MAADSLEKELEFQIIAALLDYLEGRRDIHAVVVKNQNIAQVLSELNKLASQLDSADNTLSPEDIKESFTTMLEQLTK